MYPGGLTLYNCQSVHFFAWSGHELCDLIAIVVSNLIRILAVIPISYDVQPLSQHISRGRSRLPTSHWLLVFSSEPGHHRDPRPCRFRLAAARRRTLPQRRAHAHPTVQVFVSYHFAQHRNENLTTAEVGNLPRDGLSALSEVITPLHRRPLSDFW
jgi:hypothetical protein